jgi:hypothetical protein
LHRFFSPSKLISKCCNFSMDWDGVKGLSVLLTRYLTIHMRPLLACQISKIFLAMKGACRPVQIKQKGAHPPSGNPPMYLFDRVEAAPKKWSFF